MSSPIVQYWHDGEPPPSVAGLLESFSAHNPDLPHLVFDDVEAGELIAANFGERELAAFSACAVPAMQADYFRFCALFALGGVYADVDFRCKGSLSPLLADGGATVLFGYPTKVRVGGKQVPVVGNNFMAFPRPEHPLLRLCIDVATAQIEQRIAENVWLITGPGVLTALNLLYMLGDLAEYEGFAAGTRLKASAAVIPAAVGDYRRAAAAFADVRILPVDERRPWVGGAGFALPYKKTGAHWTQWQEGPHSIFR